MYRKKQMTLCALEEDRSHTSAEEDEDVLSEEFTLICASFRMSSARSRSKII